MAKNAMAMVLFPCMSITSARRKLRNIDANVGIMSRREFRGYLSDDVAAFHHLAKKCTWPKKPVNRQLYMACSAIATEWYLNNGRISGGSDAKTTEVYGARHYWSRDYKRRTETAAPLNCPSTRAHTNAKAGDFPDIEAAGLLQS